MVLLQVIPECFMNPELPSDALDYREEYVLSCLMLEGIRNGSEVPLHITLVKNPKIRNKRIWGVKRNRRGGRRYGPILNRP